MKLVIIESPFAKSIDDSRENNLRYARSAMRDCLLRGESPYASHLLYTQDGVLDDDIPEERTLGIDAGLDWGSCAEASVIYIDRGISSGMLYGIKNAIKKGREREYRSLPEFSLLPCKLKTLKSGDYFFYKLTGMVGIVVSVESDSVNVPTSIRVVAETLEGSKILFSPDELVFHIPLL
ncbi:hypothetical protein D3C71_1557530 [compost metagenome]